MRILAKSESDDLIADNMAQMEVMMDTGVINWASRPLERMFGYNLPGELEGEQVEILVPLGIIDKHAKVYRPSFTTKPEPRMMGRKASDGRLLDLKGRRKDGTEFPAEVLLLPKSSNRIRVIVVFVFDMSDRA